MLTSVRLVSEAKVTKRARVLVVTCLEILCSLLVELVSNRDVGMKLPGELF